MSSYDYDDRPVREHHRYTREERREERGDPRYGRDSYLKPYAGRELVPRSREDSDLSVEEVRRDFPPPGYSSRDVRRARSADPRYDDYDEPRGYDRGYDDDRDHDRHRKKGSSSTYYEEERTRRRVLSKQEQIIAAVAGAALAVGGKELFDRREAKEHHSDVKRNPLTSAALAAAGAAAAYQGAEFYNKQASKEEKKATYILHRGRDGKVSEYYSDEDEDPKAKKGHKNFFESALGAAGLGTAVKALTGGHDDKRDNRSRRGSSGSRSRSGSRSGGGKNEAIQKIQKAAMASLIAGATEAFRVRKEPGSWSGEKTKRILTAAAGAGAIDSAQREEHGKLGILESVIGGLGANRLIRGSKNNIEEDKTTGRSRSRSRARSTGGGGGGGASGLAALATAGLGALGAKKLADTVQRSRSQSRSRRRSVDSYDSRGGSPDRRHRSRSRSVVDSARKGLAKLGIGSAADDKERDRRRDRDDDDDHYSSSRRGEGRRGGRDEYDDRPRGGGGSGKRRDSSRRRGGGGSSDSDSSLGDSDADEKEAKKKRGKQILTTGLAAVATIHATHAVYQSVEKRQARKKAVRQGRLSPEEAKKLKTKALLQDAASVGIAALGIKGAISEMKEARELQHECKEWQEEKARRHQRRLERQRNHNGGNGSSNSSVSVSRRRRSDGYSTSNTPRPERDLYYDEGPRYYDGNPYAAALPAPPIGYDDRR